jgi:hypothetical protein
MPSNLPPREFFTALGLETFDCSEMEERFEDMLDETCAPARIGYLSFPASQVLRELDRVAYRQAFLEYLDAEGIEEYGDFCASSDDLRMAERLWAAPMVIVEVMPDHLVASHEAAGNWGIWPHNGADRFLILESAVGLIDGNVIGPASQADKLDYRIEL